VDSILSTGTTLEAGQLAAYLATVADKTEAEPSEST
jgi:hypothetical protein